MHGGCAWRARPPFQALPCSRTSRYSVVSLGKVASMAVVFVQPRGCARTITVDGDRRRTASERLERTRPCGRREEALELGNLVLSQWMLQSRNVFFQPLAIARLGNDNHIFMSEE